MGSEENAGYAFGFRPAAAPAFGFSERFAREQAVQEAAERRALADALADQLALPVLADSLMPPDIREFGERHKIPQFSRATYINGFIDGWRAAHRALTQRRGDGQ